MNELIERVDFQHLEKYKGVAYNPALIVFPDLAIQVDNWRDAIKLFFYFAFKNDKIRKFIVDSVNVWDYKNIFCKRLSVSPWLFSNPIKFSTNLYFNLCVDKAVSLFDTERYTDNLTYINEIIQKVGFPDFEFYLTKLSVYDKVVQQEQRKTIKNFTSKKATVKRTEKKAKFIIARINEETYTPLEKLNLKVSKQFKKKVLIGDILLSEEDSAELKKHMADELQRLNLGSSFKCNSVFRPHYPYLFALGLVQFAMKRYEQKTFWPYFEKEYGVNVEVNKQGELHETFRSIIVATGKKYDDDATMKIDNISMHSFVTDKCAPQLFDYLFYFWRVDLNRNIDNLRGETGKEIYKLLLEEMSQTKQNVGNVMKHTSLAIINNKPSCNLRIRRILNFIDECYWNQTEVPNTGNRINRLLNNWMSNPKGEFQKVYQQKQRLHSVRGETLFTSPLLCMNYATNSFSIKLPRQILKGCTEEEYPQWVIENENKIVGSITPDLLQSKIAIQTDECEVALDSKYLFKKLKLTLASSVHKYVSFSIKPAEYRFFNEKGELVSYDSKYIPCGNLTCFSLSPEFPKVLYSDEMKVYLNENLHVCHYNLTRGDILLFPDKTAMQAGERLQDGLSGEHALLDVHAVDNGSEVDVYNKLPKVLFKATREQLTGTGLFVKNSYGEKRFKVINKKHYEFKLDDTVDDIYAYVIDLNDFEIYEGVVHIHLDIPHGKWSYNYDICYLKDLHFKFVGAPYVFSEWGRIEFAKYTPILIDDDTWDQTENTNRLFFNFDTSIKNCSAKTKDCRLNLDYLLNHEKLKLSFDIPALFWKYDKDDEWSSNSPADILLKNIPSHMYVKGPFGFTGKRTYLDLDEDTLEEETRISVQKVSGQNYFEFPLLQMKSWLNHDMDSCKVSIILDGSKHHLLNVVCRSKILNHIIYGDFENGVIYGKFDIEGAEQYIVNVSRGDVTIAEVPLIDGRFEAEAYVEEGKYDVTVFELEDSDDGFDDVSSFVIGKFEVDIIDKFNLVDKSIEIKAIQDYNKKFKPLELFARHIITDLMRIGGYDDFLSLNRDIVGIRGDIDPEDCLYYTGILRVVVNDRETAAFDVLLVFYDKVDISKVSILRFVDDEKYPEYQELFYNAFTRTLVEREADAGKNKFSIKQNLRILYDDEYELSIEIITEKKHFIKLHQPSIQKKIEVKQKVVHNNVNETILDIPIDKIGLSVRSYNCLKRAHKMFVRDIIDLSDGELLRIRNLGRTNVEEIRAKILELKNGI